MRTASTRPGSDGGGAELLAEYDARLTVAREEFDRYPAVTTLFRGAMEPVTMEAFLIAFSVLGIHTAFDIGLNLLDDRHSARAGSATSRLPTRTRAVPS